MNTTFLRPFAACATLLLAGLVLAGCAAPTPTTTPVPRRPTLAITRTETVILPTSLPPTETSDAPPEPTELPDNCTSLSSEQHSPSGVWVALSCNYMRDDARLIVTRKQGPEWELPYADYVVPGAAGMGADGLKASGGLYPVFWSQDGAYLFFVLNVGWDGGGTCFYGYGAQGLFRLDLRIGKVSSVLPSLPSNDPDTYTISFSPTGRRFVYSREQLRFHVVDLISGKDTSIPADGESGTYVWSTDGLSLAYAVSQCDSTHMRLIYSAIKILEISTLASKTVIQSDKDFLTVQEWTKVGLLVIHSLDYSSSATTILSINSENGAIVSSATATP